MARRTRAPAREKTVRKTALKAPLSRQIRPLGPRFRGDERSCKSGAPARRSRASKYARRKTPAPKKSAPKKSARKTKDSNRARKFGRKIPRQEIPTPRGRPYVPIHRSYTPELLANGRRRYEETREPVAAIAVDFRIHPGSLRRLAGLLGWVRFAMGPRDLPRGSRLLTQAETLEAAGRQTPGDFAAAIHQLERKVRAELASVTTLRERFKGLPRGPRESESTARTLPSLTQTLQKLQLMRCGLTSPDTDDDDLPADLDAFRIDLARRIDAFVASRAQPDDAARNAGADTVDQAR
jgi:hypothetical protein